MWICEKMGAPDQPWTTERQTREQRPVQLGDGSTHVVHDRSSAHRAAWYSPKRSPSRMGRRFKLDDVRVWMRLMFWAGIEQGLLDGESDASRQFTDWFVRFIGASIPAVRFSFAKPSSQRHIYLFLSRALFAAGHFVRVYENSGPTFTRDSYRWAQDASRRQVYLDAGRQMSDVIGVSFERASRSLPEREISDWRWPY